MTPEGWVLRVASRPEFGGGHVHRCLALACALQQSAPVVFALDAGGERWRERIAAAGFSAVTDEGLWAEPVAGAILDHCVLDPVMLSRWRGCTRKLVVLRDDVEPGDRLDHADLEIRQWATAERAPGILSGPEYILIDPAFAQIEDAVVRPLPAHLLVAFGMRDSPDATSLVLEALSRLSLRWQPQVTVALGRHAPHVAGVRRLVESLGARARLLLDEPDMRHALADCDLAVGAGGVSAAERAAAGRASLTIALSPSQRPVADLLAGAGATIDCGVAQDLTAERLATMLWAVAEDPAVRTGLAQAGRRTVDGQGPQRVAEAVLAV